MKMKYILFSLVPFTLLANPQGEHVASGDCSFSRSSKSLTITQKSDKAIIHWNDFSISKGEATKFAQPNKKSAVLNRVTTNKPSKIHGLLEGNGKIYLINQNGILIGPEGQVRSAGFIASTLQLSDEQFLSSKEQRFTGSSTASLSNEGSIQCDGNVYFIARKIEDYGHIRSTGEVYLLAGSEVLITTNKDKTAVSIQGEGEIDQKSLIEAVQIQLHANGGNVNALAINQEGIIHAKGFEERDGQIFLSSETGIVSVKGTLEAKTADQGGTIHLLGQFVHILDNAKIDASGDLRGGTVLVGGDYKGENPEIRNALAVFVSPDSFIDVSCKKEGNGGKAIFWGDHYNQFYGKALALGGPIGGNGGFVEVSSHGVLEPHGYISTLAPNGKTGMLLFDPVSVVINPATTVGVAPAPPYPPCPVVTSYNLSPPAAATVNIGATDLANYLSCSDVTINAATDTGPGIGNVNFNIPFSWTSGNTLIVNAGSGIAVGSAAPISCSGSGSLILNANLSGTSPGVFDGIDIVSSITLTGGNLTMTAIGSSGKRGVWIHDVPATAPNLAITTVTGNISITGTSGGSAYGVYIDPDTLGNGYIHSGSGSVSVIGHANAATDAAGVYLDHCEISTGGGTGGITIQGNSSGTGLAGIAGVLVNSSSGKIISSGGDVQITGTATASPNGSGVQLAGPVQLFGSNNLFITGTGGAPTGAGVLVMYNLQTVDGNITINGDTPLGVAFDNSGFATFSTEATGTGNISITGIGTTREGIRLSNGAQIYQIKTNSGTLTLNGQGSATGGINLQSSGGTPNQIVTTSGTINLIGTGLGGAYDINIDLGRIDNGSGTTNITANTASGLIVQNPGTSYIGFPTTTGPINITADTINLLGTVNTTGVVTIQPLSPATSIGFGAGTGTFTLPSATVAQIGVLATPSLLAVGYSSGSHTIDISGVVPLTYPVLFRGNNITIDTFTGGIAPLYFNIGQTAAGSLDLGNTITSGTMFVTGFGSADSNTLFAQDIMNTWNVTGNNSGTINGSGFVNFSNVGNLVGGNLNDTFVFADQQGVSGFVDGGGPIAPGIVNTLDYTAYTTPAIVEFLTATSGNASNLGAGFFNINSAIGNWIVPPVVVIKPPTFFTQTSLSFTSFLSNPLQDRVYPWLQLYLLDRCIRKGSLFLDDLYADVLYQKRKDSGLNPNPVKVFKIKNNDFIPTGLFMFFPNFPGI